ncbi:exopolyphosphatase [Marinospirillum minutulum]|uniref:exopolyphosphatase n=1 Tax=Marinospirillum minutulum TaxID=64974 RepID=UPI0004241DDD|nr:exopolyphosphatase [Marinospirillum minutulum]
MSKKYRLVTRSDFDGLVCAALLKHLDLIDDIQFVHPKDMQDGKIEIDPNDITTNLPYVAGCYLAFDHHLSETVRNEVLADNHIIDAEAPSAARVVWQYYGGHSAFPEAWDEMMAAVDKGDAAQFNEDEVLNPDDWVLLNFIMDARTGLGRFRDFRISNYQLMMQLIDYCRNHTIKQILELPDVKERTDLYFEHDSKARQQIQKCAKVYDNLVVLDLRNEETIYATNRFTLYALYPNTNISIHIMWGLKQQNTVFAVGKSILNRSSNTNVGELCLKYNGGGHLNAGTCQVANDQAEATLEALIKKINADG